MRVNSKHAGPGVYLRTSRSIMRSKRKYLRISTSIDKSLICREQAGYYDLAVALVLWLGTAIASNKLQCQRYKTGDEPLDASLSARTTGWYAEGNLAMARA
jgi:hypothetical protein